MITPLVILFCQALYTQDDLIERPLLFLFVKI